MTAQDDIAGRIAGLDAGADDYVVNHYVDELNARIRAVIRRHLAADNLDDFGGRTDARSRAP